MIRFPDLDWMNVAEVYANPAKMNGVDAVIWETQRTAVAGSGFEVTLTQLHQCDGNGSLPGPRGLISGYPLTRS